MPAQFLPSLTELKCERLAVLPRNVFPANGGDLDDRIELLVAFESSSKSSSPNTAC